MFCFIMKAIPGAQILYSLYIVIICITGLLNGPCSTGDGDAVVNSVYV